MNKFILPIFSILILTFFAIGCSRDELEESDLECDDSVTYTSVIKSIIDESCAYSGCHDGGAGIGPGDYTTFQGLSRDLTTGSFKSRTIDQRDSPSIGMPPDNSVYPESLKDDLSSEELEMITCWIDSGFPE